MAATLTDDKTKLKQEIFNLETEEIELDKKILRGTISQEEGRQKKADLAFRLSQLQTAEQIPVSTPEQEDKNHKKDTHNDAPHPHPEEEVPQASAPNTAETPVSVPKPPPATPFRPTTPNPQVNALNTAVRTPPPPKPLSGKQKIAKGAGKFMMYTTPGGFIVGKTAPRIKERLSARKEVSELEKTGTENRAKQQTSQKNADAPQSPSVKKTAGNKYLKSITPLGWVSLGDRFLPESFMQLFKKKNKAPESEKPIDKKQQPDSPTQNPQKPSVKKAVGKAYIKKATPMGWAYQAGAKFLPENVKAPLRKLIPKPKPSSEKQDEQAHKTAKEYQKIWNKTVIGKAISKGYDRSATLQHIRNSKIWQSRIWKSGKRLMTPNIIPAKKFLSKKQEEKSSESHASSHPSLSQHTKQPEGVSPTGLYKKTWNKFGGSQVSRLNTAMGRRLGNPSPRSVGRAGTRAAGRAASNAANKIGGKVSEKLAQQAASQLTQLGGKALILNPPVLIGIGVALLILLAICAILLIIMSLTGSDTGGAGGAGEIPNQSTNPIPGFTLVLSTIDTQVEQGDLISYTVKITYTDPDKFSTITVFNELPPGTEYVTTTGGVATYEAGSGRVSWSLANADNQDTFSFVLKANQNDILVRNMVYATQAGTSSGGGDLPPTAENCGGEYTLANPVGNFGDPDCYFASSKEQAMSELYDLIKAQDPSNAYNWYMKVIPCESVPPYNPNSHSSAEAIGSPDSAGVWGMFSMGRGLNGEFDHGDVPWRSQVTNALTYGNNLKQLGIPLAGEDGGYWDCWNKKHLL